MGAALVTTYWLSLPRGICPTGHGADIQLLALTKPCAWHGLHPPKQRAPSRFHKGPNDPYELVWWPWWQPGFSF